MSIKTIYTTNEERILQHYILITRWELLGHGSIRREREERHYATTARRLKLMYEIHKAVSHD